MPNFIVLYSKTVSSFSCDNPRTKFSNVGSNPAQLCFSFVMSAYAASSGIAEGERPSKQNRGAPRSAQGAPFSYRKLFPTPHLAIGMVFRPLTPPAA
jgi:hypothetical protein